MAGKRQDTHNPPRPGTGPAEHAPADLASSSPRLAPAPPPPPLQVEPPVTWRTGLGLFLVTLATLMYEVLLTRILSVTMWYHFAFMAISVAMFGMTVGALIVYLAPARFPPHRTPARLASSALGFAGAVVFTFLLHLRIPFKPDVSPAAFAVLGLTYVLLSIPFIFSGIVVCLALTRFPRRVGSLYAADLTGSALGAVLLIGTLHLTDGPTAVLVVALLAGFGAAAFAAGGPAPTRRVASVLCILLAVAAVGHGLLVHRGVPLLRLTWVKGSPEPPPLYEKWNAFSRILVTGDPDAPTPPFGWGLSAAYPPDRTLRQLHLSIDGSAGTILTAFDGDLATLEHLKYDVTNVAHYLRPNARVLVVGTGGGRDVLAALAFGQRSVLGVELNEDILRTVNGRFGAFTGQLDRHPRVAFANDEARSYLARSRERFDLIQVSLIDTWAATAAGAFALSENALYTVEAWQIFLDHLTPTGLLSVSRWYYRDRPGEMYRLTALASASLLGRGLTRPRDHLAIVRHRIRSEAGEAPDGIGTLLLSPVPLTREELATLDAVAGRLRFEVVLSPAVAPEPTFAALASGEDLDAFVAAFPLDIAPPTDDRPFFFQMLRLTDILRPDRWEQGLQSFNMKAVFVLGTLLLTVVGLTVLCILVPLALTSRRGALRGAVPWFLFFGGIGAGFMLVEIALLQRLILFLGHPTYSLSVVLFSLLLSGGLGSALSARWPGNSWWAGLFGTLIGVGMVASPLTGALQTADTPLRIVAAAGLLFPLGVFMGVPFPTGMGVAARRLPPVTPWLWGMNGATSVCGSVAGAAIALGSGISATFWAGVAAYLVAFAAFGWAMRRGA